MHVLAKGMNELLASSSSRGQSRKGEHRNDPESESRGDPEREIDSCSSSPWKARARTGLAEYFKLKYP